MNSHEPKAFYTQSSASSFDKDREKLAPLKDALHLCIRLLLSELPVDARILCVGVGTGAELIYLAQTFPQWQFTAVDPSVDMLNVCRLRTKESDVNSRCTFHQGYLDSLPESDNFDAATSILVSHFITDPTKRSNYFADIAARLLPGAYLINADLAADMSSIEYTSMLTVWKNMLEFSGIPINIAAFGNKIAMLPINKFEAMITASGFTTPVLFFQTLLIHAWFSKVNTR